MRRSAGSISRNPRPPPTGGGPSPRLGRAQILRTRTAQRPDLSRASHSGRAFPLAHELRRRTCMTHLSLLSRASARWVLICGGMLAGACSSGSRLEPPVTAEARAEAEQVFKTRCVACHGAEGRGDGPKAAGLPARPRNFSDLTWHLSVSDRHIEQVIREGGTAAGKSSSMPSNPDLRTKPAVVAALRVHLRTLGVREE